MQDPAYAELTARLKRQFTLGTVAGLLGWDEQVNLPPDSVDQRAEQMALLAELMHAEISAPRVGELLAVLERSPDGLGEPLAGGGDHLSWLAPEQRVVVKQARRDHDRATKLPADFVRERAIHSSQAFHAWTAAKAKSDFAAFAPYLEKHVTLAQHEADLMGWGGRAYDYWIDQFDPGMSSAAIEELFAELKAGLVPLVRTITASPVKSATRLLQGFSVEGQRAFLHEVTGKLGFDFRRGRIDVSLHPFCEGSGADIRMTTRFDENAPLDALFSAIHETGHGLYEQGLPREHAGTALGMNAGMSWHESQSRLWENQVARSRAFWRSFEPRLRACFPTQLARISSDELYLAINAVKPGLIRVDADEVTYNLHILLRFDLERRLFAGALAVRDLPGAWDTQMQELLGLTPPDAARGVLQDVHWSAGSFGYFPSYCLGNMIAAQLWETARSALPGLEDDFARGDFARLLGWLRTNVHALGRRHETPEMVRLVTGRALSPQSLLRYLHERYGSLYLH
ncbi:MAG: carboxypeptidase M32 [Opitutaceae bacterium]|nr:carboxypeptidase M32 [Opitutaceae bacterium]